MGGHGIGLWACEWENGEEKHEEEGDASGKNGRIVRPTVGAQGNREMDRPQRSKRGKERDEKRSAERNQSDGKDLTPRENPER